MRQRSEPVNFRIKLLPLEALWSMGYNSYTGGHGVSSWNLRGGGNMRGRPFLEICVERREATDRTQ